jgi:hypothetical protein
LNGFAKTDLVGEHQAQGQPPHDRKRRLELERQKVDGRKRRGAEVAEAMGSARMRLQKT